MRCELVMGVFWLILLFTMKEICKRNKRAVNAACASTAQHLHSLLLERLQKVKGPIGELGACP